jgi:SAM-dependent methyltransferase
MGLRDAARRRIGGQLANPHGRFGRLVARRLNALNRSLIEAAIETLQLKTGDTAADLGFGGGLGLRLLLDRVGGAGEVHGVDRSDVALAGARGSYSAEIAAGRLSLHDASMTALPLAAGSVDGIVTTNTIYFLDDAGLTAALGECARVLRRSGRLAVGISDPEAMARNPLVGDGFRIRPLDDVVTAAAAAGLRLAEHHRPADNGFAPHLLVFAAQ